MEHAFLLNSPKCSSESVSKPGAWLGLTEPPFFLALNTNKRYNTSVTGDIESLCITRAGSEIQEEVASSKVILLNFSLSKEGHLLFRQQEFVSDYKNSKHFKISYHIKRHQLLQPNILSFTYVKKNSLREREKYKLKTLFLIYLFFFPCPTSGEARRQLYLIT